MKNPKSILVTGCAGFIGSNFVSQFKNRFPKIKISGIDDFSTGRKDALEKVGFVFSRQSGSHKIYKNSEGRRVTAPFHSDKILHPKVLKSILNDADLKIEKLREFL